MVTNDDEYTTNDLAIAAMLVEHDYAIKRLDRNNPNRVVFEFQDTNSAIPTLVDGYWQNLLLVNPRSYFETLKQLKSRIYGGV